MIKRQKIKAKTGSGGVDNWGKGLTKFTIGNIPILGKYANEMLDLDEFKPKAKWAQKLDSFSEDTLNPMKDQIAIGLLDKAVPGLGQAVDGLGKGVSKLENPDNPNNSNPKTLDQINPRYAQMGGKIKMVKGGILEPISKTAVQAHGKSHEEGGVELNKQVEIEGGEGVHDIKGKTVVSSDTLKDPDNGYSFAEIMTHLERQKGKYERLLDEEMKKNEGKMSNSAILYKKKIKELTDEINKIYQKQEAVATQMGLRDAQGNPNQLSQDIVPSPENPNPPMQLSRYGGKFRKIKAESGLENTEPSITPPASIKQKKVTGINYNPEIDISKAKKEGQEPTVLPEIPVTAKRKITYKDVLANYKSPEPTQPEVKEPFQPLPNYNSMGNIKPLPYKKPENTEQPVTPTIGEKTAFLDKIMNTPHYVGYTNQLNPYANPEQKPSYLNKLFNSPLLSKLGGKIKAQTGTDTNYDIDISPSAITNMNVDSMVEYEKSNKDSSIEPPYYTRVEDSDKDSMYYGYSTNHSKKENIPLQKSQEGSGQYTEKYYWKKDDDTTMYRSEMDGNIYKYTKNNKGVWEKGALHNAVPVDYLDNKGNTWTQPPKTTTQTPPQQQNNTGSTTTKPAAGTQSDTRFSNSTTSNNTATPQNQSTLPANNPSRPNTQPQQQVTQPQQTTTQQQPKTTPATQPAQTTQLTNFKPAAQKNKWSDRDRSFKGWLSKMFTNTNKARFVSPRYFGVNSNYSGSGHSYNDELDNYVYYPNKNQNIFYDEATKKFYKIENGKTISVIPRKKERKLFKPYFKRENIKFKSGGWIQNVNKSIKQRGTEGRCSGANFGGPDCPKGSPQYNLAVTFKKMAKNKTKHQSGGSINVNVSGNYSYLPPKPIPNPAIPQPKPDPFKRIKISPVPQQTWNTFEQFNENLRNERRQERQEKLHNIGRKVSDYANVFGPFLGAGLKYFIQEPKKFSTPPEQNIGAEMLKQNIQQGFNKNAKYSQAQIDSGLQLALRAQQDSGSNTGQVFNNTLAQANKMKSELAIEQSKLLMQSAAQLSDIDFRERQAKINNDYTTYQQFQKDKADRINNLINGLYQSIGNNRELYNEKYLIGLLSRYEYFRQNPELMKQIIEGITETS